MSFVFEVIDKSGRLIHISTERWKHIRKEHPEIVHYEELIHAIIYPDKITASDRDESVAWYYLYNKARKRYLKVSVKYLNGHGYIITSHHTAKLE